MFYIRYSIILSKNKSIKILVYQKVENNFDFFDMAYDFVFFQKCDMNFF